MLKKEKKIKITLKLKYQDWTFNNLMVKKMRQVSEIQFVSWKHAPLVRTRDGDWLKLSKKRSNHDTNRK